MRNISDEEAIQVIHKEFCKSEGIDSEYTTYDVSQNAWLALKPLLMRESGREREQTDTIIKLMGEKDKLYKFIAPLIGFKEFPINPHQKAWAKSQEQANALDLGESIYKFVRNEIEGENT